jgi:hypothetical protein
VPFPNISITVTEPLPLNSCFHNSFYIKEVPPSPEEGKEEREKPKPKKKRFGFWMNVYLTKEELDELSKITLYQDLISKYSEYKSRHIFKPIRDYEAILYFQKHKEVSEEMFLDENAEYW